jgi:hypothetical protein
MIVQEVERMHRLWVNQPFSESYSSVFFWYKLFSCSVIKLVDKGITRTRYKWKSPAIKRDFFYNVLGT